MLHTIEIKVIFHYFNTSSLNVYSMKLLALVHKTHGGCMVIQWG